MAAAGGIDQGSKKIKINVQVVRLATAYKAMGKNEKIEIEFPGKTMRDTLVFRAPS
jgi:hypothetical protein